MDFLTQLASFSEGSGKSFSAEGDVFNFSTIADFLKPFGKVAGAIAKLLGLVK
ncbi:hypothetical protein [Corynebacterium aquilae]|uniref:hypothetical protein n=1 Tax=Corynebacterium aquilae TaxID=203263 RepID=UPI0012EE9A77|nr:hypothetical protein [Corynebacterium aquilae]